MATTSRHRRFAHLTSDDVEILDALEPAAARIFEALLQRQHRARRRSEQFETVESDLGDQALEQLHARTEARWSAHGAGGGRRRGISRDPDEL